MKEIDKELFIAIKKNKPLKKIEQLIKNGANVNVQDSYGKTPLIYAINYKKNKLDLISFLYIPYNIRLFKVLLKNGADVNIQDKNGNTIIYYIFKKASLFNPKRVQKFIFNKPLIKMKKVLKLSSTFFIFRILETIHNSVSVDMIIS